jgi:hypothetical protein
MLYSEPLDPVSCEILYETLFIDYYYTSTEIVQNFEHLCDKFNVIKSALVEIMHRWIINCLIDH